ncbi:MAG: AI-2E family transporter [Betaproteobacteria bacterium]
MRITETPESAYAQLAAPASPFVKPVGTALAVVVFTIPLLVYRENMRERLVALIGTRRIPVTTQALGGASYRVSRYLFAQLLINAAFGVPNAVLWGLLAALLRFIPYAGVWIAVAMPALLAFAISEGWWMIAWTLGVFLALELALVNFVEPRVYGRSSGLSPVAIIAAALFWTWLWGPIGLRRVDAEQHIEVAEPGHVAPDHRHPGAGAGRRRSLRAIRPTTSRPACSPRSRRPTSPSSSCPIQRFRPRRSRTSGRAAAPWSSCRRFRRMPHARRRSSASG